jgi:hypothetical protein
MISDKGDDEVDENGRLGVDAAVRTVKEWSVRKEGMALGDEEKWTDSALCGFVRGDCSASS